MKKMSKVLLACMLLFAFLIPLTFGAGEDDFIISADAAPPEETPAQEAAPAPTAEPQAAATPAEPAATPAVQAMDEPTVEPTAAATVETVQAAEENPQIDRSGDTEGIIIISPGEIEPEELQKFISPVRPTQRAEIESSGTGVRVPMEEGEIKAADAQAEAAAEEDGEPVAESSQGAVVFDRAETEESGLMLVDSSGGGKVERAGYILVENAGFVSDNFKEDGFLYSKQGRMIISQSDEIYIKLTVGKAVKPGREFIIYNDDEEVVNPMNDEYLGRYVAVCGYLKVIKKVKDDVYKARVIRSYSIIRTNYKIKMRNELKQYHNKLTGKVPSKVPDIQGFLIKVKGNTPIISGRNIVFLDRGLKDGVMPGMRFDVFRKTVDEETGADEDYHAIGKISVINSMKNAAVGIVTSQSELFRIGDAIKSVKK